MKISLFLLSVNFLVVKNGTFVDVFEKIPVFIVCLKKYA